MSTNNDDNNNEFFSRSARVYRRNFERDKSDLIAHRIFSCCCCSMEGERENKMVCKRMNDNENHPYKYMRRTAQQVISFWVDLVRDGRVREFQRKSSSGWLVGWKRNVDWEWTMKAQKESKRANTKYSITMLDSQKNHKMSWTFWWNSKKMESKSSGNLPHKTTRRHKQCMHLANAHSIFIRQLYKSNCLK